MYAISVMIEVEPDRIEDYKAAALAHAHNTRSNEEGCISFNVFQSEAQPNLFYYHELYVNKAAVEEVHKKAPYLALNRERTKGMVIAKEIKTWESVE